MQFFNPGHFQTSSGGQVQGPVHQDAYGNWLDQQNRQVHVNHQSPPPKEPDYRDKRGDSAR